MAWNIVRHAFAMVFNNFGQALRATVGPGLLLMAAWLLFFVLTGLRLDIVDGNTDPATIPDGISRLSLLLILPLLAFSFFVMGWIAVAWHRFILLEEYSGILPASTGRPIWGYIGKSLLLGLVLGLAAIPLSMVIGLVTLPFLSAGAGPSVIVFAISGLLIGTVIGILWFRTAICLPAKAVGKNMTFREAWTYTREIKGKIVGVTVIIVGLNICAGLVLEIVFSGVPVMSLVAELAINWVSMMVGISVLTTIYGHVVEGRPLSGS